MKDAFLFVELVSMMTKLNENKMNLLARRGYFSPAEDMFRPLMLCFLRRASQLIWTRGRKLRGQGGGLGLRATN